MLKKLNAVAISKAFRVKPAPFLDLDLVLALTNEGIEGCVESKILKS